MVPPPGIGLAGKILRLDKRLYRLKEVWLAWVEKLSEALADIGVTSLPFDPCVFISAHHKIIVLVYVGDISTA